MCLLKHSISFFRWSKAKLLSDAVSAAKLPQSDGSLFDNNPLLYPYVTHDHVLFWEDDPFETAVRAWCGKRPSVAIARAEVVRKR